MDYLFLCLAAVLLLLLLLFVWLLVVVIRALKRRALLKPVLLWTGTWAGTVTLIFLAILYAGYCWGKLGEDSLWLRYFFQCSCPPSTENIRFQQLYPEHDVEVMVTACESASIGPIPSPSGQKVAVMNYDDPDGFYVWFLQTDERMPFTWLGGDLIWLSDDLLFVRWRRDANVVDLDARAEYSIPVRSDVRPAGGEIAPDVLSALREARYVILTMRAVTAISPDALASPERSFVIPHDASAERMGQFLQDQDIDYLDYSGRWGKDVLSLLNHRQKYGIAGTVPYVDLVSPDGRFFYRDSYDKHFESGIYLVETDEKIVDHIRGLRPVDWLHDGVIIRSIQHDHLIYLFPDVADVNRGLIHEPWLKLRVPAEYNESQ